LSLTSERSDDGDDAGFSHQRAPVQGCHASQERPGLTPYLRQEPYPPNGGLEK
jgi:hypothetical protein